MAPVQVVADALSGAELGAARTVRCRHPAYVRAGGRRPPGVVLPRPRVRPVRLRLGHGLDELPWGRLDTIAHATRLDRHHLATTGQARPALQSAYLRATYAAAAVALVDGADVLLGSPRLAERAHDLFDAELVQPWTVYANVYLPGQVLDVHTDIPAFRGAEAEQLPPWLLVAMHHTGRFERWRIPIATAIVYPEPAGSALSWYPDGGCGPRVGHEPTPNTAVVFDADTVFHRVEQVPGGTEHLGHLGQGAYLVPDGPARWELRGPAGPTVLMADEVRFSLSWKGYCFADRGAWRTWDEHGDDLTVEEILTTLLAVLADRGRLDGSGAPLEGAALAAAIIDELIPFPPLGS